MRIILLLLCLVGCQPTAMKPRSRQINIHEFVMRESYPNPNIPKYLIWKVEQERAK